MKRGFKAIISAALCAALLLGAIIPASGSSSTVYLMAVNDTVVEMTAENMPMMVNGVLYVPYTMLSSRTTGINLGVTAQYSTTRRTVLVSSENQGITFDPQANTAYDLQGRPVDARAVVRNTMVFVPLAWVCNYFGTITYSLIRTRYGTLIRVTNSFVILPDSEFVDAANNQLADNYRRYQESLQSGAESSDPGGSQSSTPPTVPPSLPPEEGPTISLVFRWGSQTDTVAGLLESEGMRALFLFTGNELAANDALVRRLVAAGHTVGLVLTGSTPQACLEEAERGGRLLASIARCAALVVQADALEGEDLDTLAAAGHVLLTPTTRSEDHSTARELIYSLDNSRINYVEIICDDQGLTMMQAAFGSVFADTGCRLRQATAPTLSSEAAP